MPGNRRNLERQRFPVGVEHEVQEKTPVQASERERQRMRGVAPIRASELYSVPRDLRPAEQLSEADHRFFCHYIPPLSERVQHPDEPVNVRMLLQQRPVEPADVAIMTIGVVVPTL